METGRAAMVVASPKADVIALLTARGDAGFARLRLRARLLGDADLFAASGDAAGAEAFRFSGMGVGGARRADGWRFRQARDVVESEDRAEKRVMMCGAEEFAAASGARARQPGCAARVERHDGDAKCRHGFGSTGNPACAAGRQGRGVEERERKR